MESLQFKSKDCPVPDEKCDGRSVSLASMKEVLSHFLSEEKEVETPKEDAPADS